MGVGERSAAAAATDGGSGGNWGRGLPRLHF